MFGKKVGYAFSFDFLFMHESIVIFLIIKLIFIFNFCETEKCNASQGLMPDMIICLTFSFATSVQTCLNSQASETEDV